MRRGTSLHNMTHHKLRSSSLWATVDARSSCEFLKVVGYSCHHFSRNKLLHTESPHPVLMRPGAQITGVRIPSLPCFQALLEQEPCRNPAAQPSARRWSCSITSHGVGGTPPSCRSIPCPAALPWVKHQGRELPAAFQPKSQSQQRFRQQH